MSSCGFENIISSLFLGNGAHLCGRVAEWLRQLTPSPEVLGSIISLFHNEIIIDLGKNHVKILHFSLCLIHNNEIIIDTGGKFSFFPEFN